jgi:hypothetical protein
MSGLQGPPPKEDTPVSAIVLMTTTMFWKNGLILLFVGADIWSPIKPRSMSETMDESFSSMHRLAAAGRRFRFFNALVHDECLASTGDD